MAQVAKCLTATSWITILALTQQYQTLNVLDCFQWYTKKKQQKMKKKTKKKKYVFFYYNDLEKEKLCKPCNIIVYITSKCIQIYVSLGNP